MLWYIVLEGTVGVVISEDSTWRWCAATGDGKGIPEWDGSLCIYKLFRG